MRRRREKTDKRAGRSVTGCEKEERVCERPDEKEEGDAVKKKQKNCHTAQ